MGNKPQKSWVLAFGDSLTEGYIGPFGRVMKPYTDYINGFQIENHGVSGETVQQIVERLDNYIIDPVSSLVFFAGTNDMGNQDKKISSLIELIETSIGKFQKRHPKAAVHLVTIFGAREPMRKRDPDWYPVRVEEFNEALRKLSEKKAFLLVSSA